MGGRISTSASVLLAVLWMASPANAADLVDSSRPLKVVVGGDVALNWRGTAVYWKTFPPERNPLLPLKGIFSEADLTFVNLEGVLMRRDPGYATARWNLWAPAVSAQVFSEAGVDVVGHANNHTFDGRSRGVLETHQHLKEAGVAVFGSGATRELAEAPYHYRGKGTSGGCLAIVPATTKLNKPQGRAAAVAYYRPGRTDALVARVNAAAKACTWVIVSVHWGAQYEPKPDDWMRALAHQLIDAGATAIVGHHAHVLGAVEHYRGRPIFYSLGNLVFSTPDVRTRRTALLVLDLFKTEGRAAVRAVMVPVFIEQRGYMPRLMNPDESRALGHHLEKLSSPFGTEVVFEGGRLSLRAKRR